MPTMMQKLRPVVKAEKQLKRAQKSFARSIKPVRKARKLTLKDVAEAVDLTPPAVLNIEKGKSWNTATVAKIARLLDRTAA